MALDDRLDDGEAETAVLARVSRGGTVREETIEDSVAMLRRDAGALVLDPQYRAAVALLETDADATTWR